jgi:flagellar assembly factor FliW
VPGFDAAKRFVLLDHRPGSIFRWLQSLDIPSLAFVVIDPLLADPQFPLQDVRTQLDLLDLALGEPIIVLGICTVPAAPELPTVNLMAPLGIGLTTKVGAQVILHDRPFSARQEFMVSNAA